MAADGKAPLELGDEDDGDFCFTGDGAGSAEDAAFDEVCGLLVPLEWQSGALGGGLLQATHSFHTHPEDALLASRRRHGRARILLLASAPRGEDCDGSRALAGPCLAMSCVCFQGVRRA
jgi:hypothetical protein